MGHHHRRRRDLARLIAGAARRSEAELAQLTRQLAGRSGPAGGDRTVPAAREWVRRWGPGRAPVEHLLPTCACVEGSCRICN
jgi:hypothetical protein